MNKVMEIQKNLYFFKINKNINKINKVFIFEKKSKNDLLIYSVLMEAIGDRTKNYDQNEFKLKKADCYDLYFHGSLKEVKNQIVLTLEISFVNPSYLENKEVNKLFEFIMEIFSGIYFSEEILKLSINNYEKYLEQTKDNPKKFGKYKLDDMLNYDNEMHLKYNEALDFLKGNEIEQKVKEKLKQINTSHNFYYFVEGSDFILNFITDNIGLNTNSLEVFKEINDEVSNKKEEIVEIKNENQVAMFMTFQTKNIDIEDEYVLKVLNLIFGGNSASKLFKNVREKENICYGISSQDKIKYGLDVIIEVDKKNIDLAKRRIVEEFEEIRKGNIQEEIEVCKEKHISSIQAETNKGYFQKLLLDKRIIYKNEKYNVEEIVKKISNVQEKDIVELAKKLELTKVLELN